MNAPQPSRLPLLIIRTITALALVTPGVWLAWLGNPSPLLALVGIAAALFSIRTGQQGESRYGRRIPVTEMLALGRQGDRAMLLGGLAGYLMLVCFILAITFLFF